MSKIVYICFFLIIIINCSLNKNSNFWIESLDRNDQDFFDQFLYHHKIYIKRDDKIKLKEYHRNWYKNWINYLNNFKRFLKIIFITFSIIVFLWMIN